MSPSNEFNDLWNDALDKYNSVTGSDLLRSKYVQLFSGCNSVDTVVGSLEQEMEKFRQFRAEDSKWAKLRSKLKPVIHVLLLFNDAAAEAASSATPGGKSIFVAFGVLLIATEGVSDCYDALMELFEKLGTFLSRLAIRLPVPSSLGDVSKGIAVDILVHLLHVFALSTKWINENRITHFFKVLIGNKEMKDALSRLDNLTKEESQAIAAETQKAVGEIAMSLQDLKSSEQANRDAISGLGIQMEQHHDSDQRDKILEWYSPLNFFLRQADIFSSWQSGTGGWLFADQVFKEWKSGSGEILWCRGIPGAGKSVLACVRHDWLSERYLRISNSSVVVERLREESAESRDTGVAVVYLNHMETERQSPSNLLAGLWRQLVSDSDQPIPPIVHRLYAKHRERHTRPSLADTHSILCSAISEYSRVFIIVDALDEYPQDLRDELLEQLLALGPTVNLMLTSRPHITIDDEPHSSIKTLEIRAAEEDIRRHVAVQIKKTRGLARHVKKSPGLQEEIERTIVQRSDGMFLLAKFHIESLVTKHTVKALRDTLANMPDNLNRTYDDIMERINRQSEDDRNLARYTLSWISNVKRPLRPAELREALAVEPWSKRLDPENRLDVDTILSVCAGLVIVDHGDNLVRFIHYTTQNYLEDIQADAFPRAQTEIASVCITYLSFEVFPRGIHDHSPHLLPHSFLDYSVDYCLEHARGQPEVDLQRCLLVFLASCSPWRKSWNRRHSFELKIPSSANALWIAAVFRLEATCRHLIKEEGVGEMLQNASLEGLTDVVRILVENGADVNAKQGEYVSPLQAAAVHGHEDIIRLLLIHGADINLRGKYGTALQVAAYFGHKESVRLLIDAGANLDAEGGKYGTALYASVIKGHNEIVALLLDSGGGAAVDMLGPYGDTALCGAVYRRDEVIARVLLEHGADVKLLIKRGVIDPDVFGSAKDLAERYGNSEIARLLIAQGVKTRIPAERPSSSAAGASRLANKYDDVWFRVGEDSHRSSRAPTRYSPSPPPFLPPPLPPLSPLHLPPPPWFGVNNLPPPSLAWRAATPPGTLEAFMTSRELRPTSSIDPRSYPPRSRSSTPEGAEDSEWQVQKHMAAYNLYNPYKRVPRPPTADYLAMPLTDNPLGLKNLVPREGLFGLIDEPGSMLSPLIVPTPRKAWNLPRSVVDSVPDKSAQGTFRRPVLSRPASAPPQLEGHSPANPMNSLYRHQSQQRRNTLAMHRPCVRKGFWNRRGDHLTVDGFVVYTPTDRTYPEELRDYPAETVGYRNHLGAEVPYLASRPELPESLPRSGLPPRRPYETFVVYD